MTRCEYPECQAEADVSATMENSTHVVRGLYCDDHYEAVRRDLQPIYESAALLRIVTYEEIDAAMKERQT
jgi:hypothetical protein